MTSISLQELRERINHKAKAEKSWRFWGIYVHCLRMDVLQEAYAQAKENNGSSGIDGVSFEDIERTGRDAFLLQIQKELKEETYLPMPNRKAPIPKEGGKTRVLSIPAIKDRVVQGALKIILEPIFEADFQEGSYGYRPGRSPHQALYRVDQAIGRKYLTTVWDIDLKSYYDEIRHHILLAKVAQRVSDPKILHLTKLILKANGKRGVPQGSVVGPLFANLYLNEVDQMLERAKEKARQGIWEHLEYARFADDIVVLIHGHPANQWLIPAIQNQLKEELSKLEIEMNTEKTKLVNLLKGESFHFLGFDIKRVQSKRTGKPITLMTPRMKKRKEITQNIKETVRRIRHLKMPVIIATVNPILAGWANYFRVGNSKTAFAWVRRWMEKKIRRIAMKKRQRKGFGWKRWSSQDIYRRWGLYDDYRLSYLRFQVKAALV